jgi:protein involved in polysaccharide export with SLBB domain
MKVAGYAREECAKTLRRKLSEYIKGDVFFSFEVTKPTLKISVFGMVSRQGSFPANNELSLVDALIMAGGWGETADLRYIRITRQSTFGAERGSVEFDLRPFLETGDSRGMPIVRPGDVVIVPKKENYILEFSGFVGSIFLLFGFFGLLR